MIERYKMMRSDYFRDIAMISLFFSCLSVIADKLFFASTVPFWRMFFVPMANIFPFVLIIYLFKDMLFEQMIGIDDGPGV